METIYLIGGAPLTGKTTLAAHYAATYSAVQLSTDNVRDWMRGVLRPADYPQLFSGHKTSAKAYYSVFNTAQKALQEEIAQSHIVETGIKALIDSRLPWKSLVLEGIALSPAFIHELTSQISAEFHITLLCDDDMDRIKRRINQRGLWQEAGSYPESVKPLELEWVIAYNQWYRAQAEQYGYQVTNVKD